MWLLARKLTKKFIPSLVSGLIYGFSPVLFSALSTGHYYFSHAEFIPLSVYIYLKHIEKPSMFRGILLSFVLTTSFFSEYYQTIFAGIILVVLWINRQVRTKQLFSNENLKLIPSLLLMVTVIILLTFSFVRTGTDRGLPLYGDAHLCSAKPFQTFLPPPGHLLFGQTLGIKPVPDTPWVFMGVVPTALLLVFLLSTFRGSTLTSYVVSSLVIIFFVGLVLSFGPVINITEKITLKNNATPFWYLQKVPLVANARCPVRYLQISFFALALISGITLSKFKKVSAILLIAIIAYEYKPNYLSYATIQIPSAYQAVADTPGDKTLLEIPLGIADGFGSIGIGDSVESASLEMYYQTIHHKPRVGGYIARIPDSTFNGLRSESVITTLVKSMSGELPETMPTETEVNHFVSKYNIGYILIWPTKNVQGVNLVTNKMFAQLILSRHDYQGYYLYLLKNE